jgi:hypothetical protein
VGTSWDEIRQYVEPIVAEINQPDGGEILRVEVTVQGNDQASVRALFSYDSPTFARNAELLRYAARLIQIDADRIEQRSEPN